MPKAAPTAAERLVRRSARAALYLSLLATGLVLKLLLWLAHPPIPAEMRRIEELQRRWHNVDFIALPEVQLLRDYIGIDTSAPDGNEVAGAEFLARHLAAAGLEPHLERLSREPGESLGFRRRRRPARDRPRRPPRRRAGARRRTLGSIHPSAA